MTTTTATSVDSRVAQAFYDRWLDAWNQDDADRVLSIVTEDFVLSSPTTRLTGHVVADATATRDYIRYIRGAYPDLIFTQTGPPLFAAEQQTVGFPWRGAGTFSGRFDPPGIDGTGRAFDFTGVEVFDFRGERAERLVASYDLLRLMRQVGVLDGSWAPERR